MSTFPPRCFTCGRVITWLDYKRKISRGLSPDEALDELGHRRPCCRRMFLGYVEELEDDINLYPRRRKNRKSPPETEKSVEQDE